MQALERSPAPMQPPLRTHGPAYPANLASEVPRTDGNFGNREIERRVPPGGGGGPQVGAPANINQRAGPNRVEVKPGQFRYQDPDTKRFVTPPENP